MEQVDKYKKYTKGEWRSEIRERLSGYTQADLKAQTQQVMALLECTPEFVEARTVAMFWSLPGEVDTHEFVERWRAQKVILLPVMQDETLTLQPFCGSDRLVCRRFGVWEPALSQATEAPELIVVPGMAFDPHGGRLGRGKGFYDRLLRTLQNQQSTPTIMGLCFDFQLVESLPTEPHDIPMDVVLCVSRKNHYLCTK